MQHMDLYGLYVTKQLNSRFCMVLDLLRSGRLDRYEIPLCMVNRWS